MQKIDKKIFSILVALLPFLFQYEGFISGVSLGESLLLPFIVVYLISDFKQGIKTDNYCGLYVLLSIVIIMNFIAALMQPFFEFNESLTILVRLVYYAALIYVARRRILLRFIMAVLCVCAFCNGIYTIMQFCSHTYFGLNLPTVISFLPVSSTEGTSYLDLENYYQYAFRPSGLFLEPSYAALFTIPALLWLLLRRDLAMATWMRIAAALVITCGIVVGSSSAGLVGVLLAWSFFAVSVLTFRDNHSRLLIRPSGIILVLFVMILLLVLLTSPLASYSIERLISGGSIGQRVLRGFILTGYLDPLTLIIGTGLNNVGEFVQYYGYYTDYDMPTNLDYVATLVGSLLNSGFMAFVGYIVFFAKLTKGQKTLVGLALVLFFIFTCLYESTAYSYRFAFYAVLAFALLDEGNIKKQVTEVVS